MKYACIVMAVICAALVPFTAVSVYRAVTSAKPAYAEALPPAENPAEAEEPQPENISAASRGSALRLVNWSPVVLYDPLNSRIYLPPSESPPKIETAYLHNVHKINVEGESFLHRRLFPGGEIIRSLDFKGSTIIVRTRRGSFAEIKREGGLDYIQVTDPRDIYKTIVVVDPGHGGHDVGAPDSKEEIFEKDINLGIVLKLMEISDREDILILPTRTGDEFVTKDGRALLGSMMGDYFISIHCNADDSSTKSSGTVTYYFNKTNAEDTGLTSEELAELVQAEVSSAHGSRDRGIVEDGGYRVLAVSDVPSVIAELMFMTNPDDLARLTDPAAQAETARALKRVIERLPARE